MNHPIVIGIQANNSFEQIEIPIVHEQVLHGETVQEGKYKSCYGHNVLSEIISAREDNRNKKHGKQTQV
jgi:hypothetical protein